MGRNTTSPPDLDPEVIEQLAVLVETRLASPSVNVSARALTQAAIALDSHDDQVTQLVGEVAQLRRDLGVAKKVIAVIASAALGALGVAAKSLYHSGDQNGEWRVRIDHLERDTGEVMKRVDSVWSMLSSRDIGGLK